MMNLKLSLDGFRLLSRPLVGEGAKLQFVLLSLLSLIVTTGAAATWFVGRRVRIRKFLEHRSLDSRKEAHPSSQQLTVPGGGGGCRSCFILRKHSVLIQPHTSYMTGLI